MSEPCYPGVAGLLTPEMAPVYYLSTTQSRFVKKTLIVAKQKAGSDAHRNNTPQTRTVMEANKRVHTFGIMCTKSATTGQQEKQRLERPHSERSTSVTVIESFSPAAEVPSSSPPYAAASAWASYDSHTCSSHHYQLRRAGKH